MSGCEFVLCSRPAEFEVDVPATERPAVPAAAPQGTIRVCSLHVTPAVTWGVPNPAALQVRYLGPASGSVAA